MVLRGGRGDCKKPRNATLLLNPEAGERHVSQRNPIKLFVSHVWEENDDYFRVFEFLESDSNFYYQNFSTPDTRPTGDKEALREDLRKQIAPAEIVIVPSSLSRKYGDLILFQMNFAKASDKPVLLLESYGVKEQIPKAIRDLADEVIDWDKRTLVDAIRRHARHEETHRWDTIEFKLD